MASDSGLPTDLFELVHNGTSQSLDNPVRELDAFVQSLGYQLSDFQDDAIDMVVNLRLNSGNGNRGWVSSPAYSVPATTPGGARRISRKRRYSIDNCTEQPQHNEVLALESFYQIYSQDFIGAEPQNHMLACRDPPAAEGSATLLEFQDSSLPVEDYLKMEELDNTGWFSDQTMGISFDLLSQILDCANHRVALGNEYYTRHCFNIAVNEMASWQIANVPGVHNEWSQFDPMWNAIKDANVIFLPVNDAYGSDVEANQGGYGGTHWTLLLVVIQDDTIQGVHFNSLSTRNGPTDRDFQNAENVFRGLRDLFVWHGRRFRDQQVTACTYTPRQDIHNQCKNDQGACGPFVWSMAAYLARNIVEYREAHVASTSYNTIEDFPRSWRIPQDSADAWIIGEQFPAKWGLFWDSQRVRCKLKSLIVRERMRRMWFYGTTDYLVWRNSIRNMGPGAEKWFNTVCMDRGS